MAQTGKRTTVNSEAVLDAALTLFAERGYHGTALSQIAEALGVRVPSLYNHMHSKHDLLLTIVSRTVTAVLDDFRTVTAGRDDPLDRLRQATLVYALRHATHRREAIVVNRDTASLDEPHRTAMQALRREHEHALRAIIEDGVAAGQFTIASPALGSFAILEMCVSIARWFRDGGPVSAEQVASEYSDFAARIAGAGSENVSPAANERDRADQAGEVTGDVVVAVPGAGEGQAGASLPAVTARRSCDTRYPPVRSLAAEAWQLWSRPG